MSIEKERALYERMRELSIDESDIEEHFIRSSGRGGQRTNKVSTCVYLKHVPTGIEVKCQRERVQALNRYHARVLLFEKIEEMVRGEESRARQRIEKLRRQKRRRSKRAKEKMLAAKRLVGDKKRLRGPVAQEGA